MWRICSPKSTGRDCCCMHVPRVLHVLRRAAAAGGPSVAFKHRLSNCDMLVSNLAQVLVLEKDGRLQQAYAARALACLLNTDSAVLRARLLLQEEELIGVAVSTNAAKDVVTDMARILVYLSAVRSGKPFTPTRGAAREAAEAAAAAAAAAQAAADAAAAAGGWYGYGVPYSMRQPRDEDSDDDEGPRHSGLRGSGKYRCGVCGQIKKGHVCPGYWVEGQK
jgi:hypothetical protein